MRQYYRADFDCGVPALGGLLAIPDSARVHGPLDSGATANSHFRSIVG
jgi:hypothetical protein